MSSDPPTPTHLNPHPPPPTTTSSSSLTPHHHHHHLLLPPPHPPNPSSPSSSSTLAPREYRKGNWTLHETLVLITAKRLDDERRSSSRSQATPSSLDVKPNINNVISSPSSSPQRRSAELRWKWVENYCWRNGCLRSQNQCNDKWDNLLRDYKKVRDYEARCEQNKDVDGGSCVSYWAMEKHDRKERNLPSNLVTEVFQALTDVLSRRNAHKGQINANAIVAAAAASRPLVVPTITMTAPPPPPLPPLQPQPINHLQVQQQQMATTPVSPPPPPAKQQQPEPSVPETSGSSETERSTESARKRRKKGVAGDLGSSVVKAASVLARSLMECEEKREKRHRELMEIEERRLRMENERMEITRHGISGLIAAVNSLSGAMHTLVSEHHQHHDDDNR